MRLVWPSAKRCGDLMGLLQDAKLDHLYDQDLAGLNPLLDAMSQRGMPVDGERRLAVAQALQQERAVVLAEMQLWVPRIARRLKIWKKKRTGPTIVPFPMTITKRATKKLPERQEEVEWYEEALPFTPSNDQMKRYAKFKGYKLPVRDGRETADETALRRLALRHETDALFPLILKYRELDKILSTYVGRPDGKRDIKGGLPVSPDGCCHTTFTHNPSTLRLSSAAPNLQNIPR